MPARHLGDGACGLLRSEQASTLDFGPLLLRHVARDDDRSRRRPIAAKQRSRRPGERADVTAGEAHAPPRVAEALTGYFWASDWAPAVSIVLLLVILVVFPKGVLSRGRA